MSAPEEARAELPRSISFNTVKRAFVIKSDYELIRSLAVFRLCAWPWLVAHARTLLNVSYSVLGHTITNFILKRTFFAHFCAGEDGNEIGPVIQRLESSGVGAILDYAAEADVASNNTSTEATSTNDLSDRREGVVSARTYEYAGEEECDANAKICLACIEDAGKRPDGFAAIKLTALGKPELLQHLSNVLMDTKRLFATFLAQQQKGSFDKKIPKIDMNTKITFADFQNGLKAINVNLNEKISKRLFKRIDSNKSGDIDYLEWISFLDPRLLGGLHPTYKLRKDQNQKHAITTLSEEEMKQLNNMIVRLEILAERAAQRSVRLMVDAEQTYFQPAIDHLVLGLQRKYNKETPLIYNTYQCYLKDAHSRLLVDIERAKREGFLFAAKLVRGAYMVQERKRSHELEIEDPICDDIEHTHQMYHKCVDLMLDNIDIADVMIASHNEKSVQYVEKRMRDVGIPAKGGGVFFGQLLGMCDHVSFTLGVMGFSVYKYVPYGKIDEVIPYLLRRAEENSNLLGSATKERQLIFRELLRRRLPFLLDYVNRVKPIAA
jgi:proline dehydrogenase